MVNFYLTIKLAKYAVKLVFQYFRKLPRYPKNTFVNYKYLNTSQHFDISYVRTKNL